MILILSQDEKLIGHSSSRMSSFSSLILSFKKGYLPILSYKSSFFYKKRALTNLALMMCELINSPMKKKNGTMNVIYRPPKVERRSRILKRTL
jgi:hypothetical protein